MDVEITVTVSVSVIGGDMCAEKIAGGLSGQPFTNGSARLGKLSLRLLLERRNVRLWITGQHRMKPRDPDEGGADQVAKGTCGLTSRRLRRICCAASRRRRAVPKAV